MPNLDLSDSAVRPHQRDHGPARRRRGPWSPTTTWRWARSSRRSRRASSGKDTCHLRRRGRSAERLRPRRRPPHRGAGHQPVHEAQVRRFDQLQPDRHGQDDRVDSGPAADESARSVGHADALLLPDKPDLTPYKVRAEQDPTGRDEPTARPAQGGGAEVRAKKSAVMDFDDGDAADEDTFNRILWHSVKGDGVPYPAEYIGDKDD